ncbi:Hypothetical protein ETEE_3939 [Edwardsiella anguillarum ET080813]|uniref:Uncharacterized protein n=1 Tax=Edwardsiella anguillarum ET080813 TaxID=667120 RepID=A0A076LV78_9GAMM|nr:Hypothetical protein ETEE_3939 [Edwardsiella anguillarum ET080813]
MRCAIPCDRSPAAQGNAGTISRRAVNKIANEARGNRIK